MILTGIGHFDFAPGAFHTAETPSFDRTNGGHSASVTAVELVDRAFTLSGTRGDLIGAARKMRPEELEAFISMTANLLKQGIVGIEILEVRGERYESFITNRIGAADLRGARRYREDPRPTPRFQAQA